MADEITRKRHDTLDTFSGIARLNGFRLNLSTFATIELHYKLKSNPTGVIKLPVVDVEDVDGSGGADIEDPPGTFVPPNRGRWRALPADGDVDEEGAYEMELECVTAGGLKVHIPNSRAANPTLNLDPDEDDL
jgi:hypothetical protein